MAIFLGIDGGGSKTSCLIGDERSILGIGVVGGSNVIRVGEMRAKEALVSAIQQACAAAKISPSQINGTCIGLAGAARPAVNDFVRRVIVEMVAGEVLVLGDMEIALEAAFGTGPGVIVIAGTGSIAYGRDSKGETARAGGWGFAVSDEGSGHWIGRSAVAAALRAKDENAAASPRLLEGILKFWHLESHEQAVLAANAAPPPDFAALFPTVLSAAGADDAEALGVLIQAGNELAGLARIVIHRIFREAEVIPVGMSGGVFGNSALVREVFYNSLHAGHSGVVLNPNVVEPVRGALELARRATPW